MKYIITLCLVFISFLSKGQFTDDSRVYHSYNEKAKTSEYLVFFKKENQVRYWNDNNLDQVTLKIVSGKVEDKNLIVQFPNSSAQYKLYIKPRDKNGLTQIICINPNKSEQEFFPVMHCIPTRLKYSTKNKNGVTEYLYFDHNPEINNIFYASSINTKKIPLEIIETKYPNNYGTKVKFPNDSKVYILKTAKNKIDIICTNPDGSVQTFYLE